jgi:2-iminoacetate synthase
MQTIPDWIDISEHLPPSDVTLETIRTAIYSDSAGATELGLLLHPDADRFLEEMAVRAQQLTRRHFGNTIKLYVPLYLSNYCSGGCVYCGFASDREQARRRLEVDEVAEELKSLKDLGFEEVLLLTGERTPLADFEYLKTCVSYAAEHFHRVTVEAFPMQQDEYAQLVSCGCTGVTLYQETYDPTMYEQLHRWGPKRDYLNRLDAPERALNAGMRTIGIGALFGLSDPIAEALRLYKHGEYLRKTWWRSGITVSFPRIRPEPGGFQPLHPINDRFLAQMIYAMRITMPEVPLVLSTREGVRFRDGMAGVGVSKMSAASRTTVGGYTSEQATDNGQFEVSDDRGVKEICQELKMKGLQPVFKDWDVVYR